MILCCTATGNSLYVAKQLDDKRISIPQALKMNDLVFHEDSIGIVCPIYGHEMSKMVKQLLQKATFHTDYFYIILTYGALHGGAAELAQNYLESVGKKANYIANIMMVDNFLPNFDMIEQCALDKKIPEKIDKIKNDIYHHVHHIEKAGLKNKLTSLLYTRMHCFSEIRT